METCASNQARAIILNYGQLKSLFESLILVFVNSISSMNFFKTSWYKTISNSNLESSSQPRTKRWYHTLHLISSAQIAASYIPQGLTTSIL